MLINRSPPRRAGSAATVQPPFTGRTDEEGRHFEIRLPGVEAENVSVDVRDGVLAVRGRRVDRAPALRLDPRAPADKPDPRPVNYLFEARLGRAADVDAIRYAHREDGVLVVTIPYKNPETRQIEIM